MSGMTFLLGMLSPRTNVKGMIAGYVGGMIPLTCSLIGMFFIPRHKSFYNSTERVLTIFFPDHQVRDRPPEFLRMKIFLPPSDQATRLVLRVG